MDGANALLAGNGLCKRFGALTVLDGVDFAVGAGEAIGIVGPNGAGKTTLLNVLSGAFPPSAGTIRVRGADVTHAGAAERCRLGDCAISSNPAAVRRHDFIRKYLCCRDQRSRRARRSCLCAMRRRA